MVGEKELKIIEEIAGEKNLTQRQLSQRTQMSLGTVNIILKRLARRGLIKTLNLNPRKVEYLLTPKGFTEKANKSYNYIFKTINLVKAIKEEIAKIVLEEFNHGQKKFIVLGNDDLADIIELALKGFDYERVKDSREIADKTALVLYGNHKIKVNGYRSINVAKRLAGIYWGVELQPYERRRD